MLEKIIAFFMAIIAFFANLFGISIPGVTEPADSGSYIYTDAAYGDEERQILDLYIPKESDGTIGLVLMIHGGAWIAGDKNAYGADVLRYVSEDVGLAAAAINYRYLSETVNLHDIIDDIDLALQFIKEKGEENGVTIDKAMLTGTSAGAHLSLLYAYSMKDTAPITPACVVSYCGPTDLADINFYYGNNMGDTDYVCLLMSYACGKYFTIDTKDEAAAELASVSPITYVDENTVPTVIAHGTKDVTVPFSNAEALDAKLTEYGVTHDFVVYPNSDHSLANDPDCSEQVNSLMFDYAIAYLQ